ncbi:hypothetical protein [Pleomorphovibrio marinus]|uniref:hypothetical protein n=1 Tax=Pleomorphovibrio marinus TaxID=2164132 RepID=UPI000E0AFEE7|nr:hypothetical protein [Pleomorphovibrio marinus]
MKLITLKIPDSKYAFFLELIKNLGLEKIKHKPSESKDKLNEAGSGLSSLRGKLHLTEKQYRDFQQHVNNSREEWNRRI